MPGVYLSCMHACVYVMVVVRRGRRQALTRRLGGASVSLWNERLALHVCGGLVVVLMHGLYDGDDARSRTLCQQECIQFELFIEIRARVCLEILRHVYQYQSKNPWRDTVPCASPSRRAGGLRNPSGVHPARRGRPTCSALRIGL